MASTAIRNDLYRGAWGVVEIDFRSYFTTIPHDKLIILIKQRVVDGSMLRLIKQSLTVGIAYEGKVEPTPGTWRTHLHSPVHNGSGKRWRRCLRNSRM